MSNNGNQFEVQTIDCFGVWHQGGFVFKTANEAAKLLRDLTAKKATDNYRIARTHRPADHFYNGSFGRLADLNWID
jgi:hypothetical protein